jgi:hypothetical protein
MAAQPKKMMNIYQEQEQVQDYKVIDCLLSTPELITTVSLVCKLEKELEVSKNHLLEKRLVTIRNTNQLGYLSVVLKNM